MKNYEVGIIIGVIALIGYFWYKNSGSTPVQQPITGGVKVVSTTGSSCNFQLVGSIPSTLSNLPNPGTVDTTIVSCNQGLEIP